MGTQFFSMCEVALHRCRHAASHLHADHGGGLLAEPAEARWHPGAFVQQLHAPNSLTLAVFNSLPHSLWRWQGVQ